MNRYVLELLGYDTSGNAGAAPPHHKYLRHVEGRVSSLPRTTSERTLVQ